MAYHHKMLTDSPAEIPYTCPIPPGLKDKVKYELGHILIDTDYDDEYSIIIDMYARHYKNEEPEIIYVHRDLNDLSRSMHTNQGTLDKWYRVV